VTPERGVFLSTVSPSRNHRRLALAVVIGSAVIFLAAVPFAKRPLGPLWTFIPLYQSALTIGDLLTAVLLFGQFAIVRSPRLLVLAAGYLFSACMTVAHMLTFPGLFSATGLLGAGPQSTAWLYMFWHGGFPLFVTAYALLGSDPNERERPRAATAVVVAGAVAAVTVIACGFTLLATAGQDLLPPIMRGNNYTPAMSGVVGSVWALSVAALVVLWRRRPRSVLDLWLMVVLAAWIFDIALAAVLNQGRWDLGFYTGRIYGLLAASFVLVVLLREHGVLYARLVQTHDRERQERARAHKAEETAAAASRAKSEFLSRMSHELRTPLNGILGFAQLLELDARSAEQRESIEHILKGGRHLLALINEVLDIARIEAGKLSVSLEPVHARDVVNGALDLVRPQAAARGIRLPEAVAADAYVMADRQRLQQILLNLLSNAVKYNRQGGGVSVRCDRGPSARVRLTVADDGPGIAPELMPRLFTPFDRLDAQELSVEGTGLGLALSRGLAELMRGTLSAESTVGEGSKFTIELPAAECPTQEVERAARPLGVEPADAGPRGTVLYVEDNSSNLRLVERIIVRRPGVTLLSAMQGRRGVELARDHRPDVILLDLHLPDVPGQDVLAQLRADPLTREIPVVILSADATPGQASRLLQEGAHAYLTKPLVVSQFLGILDELLAGAVRSS
jgi:signal transduction histidine kinase/ActR/RegA family two-component response regulator